MDWLAKWLLGYAGSISNTLGLILCLGSWFEVRNHFYQCFLSVSCITSVKLLD